MSEPNPNSYPTRTVAPSSMSLATPSGMETLGNPLAAASASPQCVGAYVILGELGRGGMGVVFRAEDPHLKREVALKVMLPQFASNPQAKARFVREARAQAKVEHDHVAAIHQVAEHEGLPYLVMPLLKGMTLHAALKANSRPPLAEVIRIGRETAEGLAAAHEKGLVHRDIKPANIWLEGKKLRVKVLDFGLARIASDADTESTEGPVTHEGAVVGTPAYMSPEQGRGLPVDGRTDLFSLGVMLYQMTTGELPFRGSTTLAILTALAVDNPPPPITRNPAVPSHLSDFIMRLLAKDPAHRPPTAEFAAEELRAIESSMVNAVRVIPLDAPPPIILAQDGPDPFAELDATEVNTAPDAEPVEDAEDVPEAVPVRAVRSRGGMPAWALVGGVLLAVAGVVGLVASQMGKKPEPEVSKGDPPQRGTSPSVVKAAPGPTDAEVRKAIEAIHAHVHLTVRLPAANEVTLAPTDPLPDGPFEVTAIRKQDDGIAVPPNFTGMIVTALARQKSFAALQDDVYSLHWTEEEFARLAATPVRETLVLFATGLDLTPKVVELLARFPNLRSVPCVRAGGADDATLTAFAALKKVDGGGVFVIDLGKSGKVSQKGWAAVAGLLVNQLTLFSPQGLDAVACDLIARMPRLTHMNINGATLDEAALQSLSACAGLKWLSLADSKIPPGGVRHLAGLKSLASLSLVRTEGVTEGDLTHLAGMKSLRGLNLFGTRLGTPEGAEKLQAALPRCLIEIPTKAYEPTDAHYREASRLLGRGCHVGVRPESGAVTRVKAAADLPDGPFVLTGVARVSNDFPFTDEDLKRLEATPTLVSLELAHVTITDAGVRSALASKQTLTLLYLAGCASLTDESLRAAGECPNLESFHFGGSKVTDAGLKDVAGLPRLHTVGVTGTAMTDAGLKHLAGLPVLRHLYLDETAVSDGGVETFAGMKGLLELTLSGTHVSAAGHKRLAAALPKCKVVWEDPNRYVANYLLRPPALSVTVRTAEGKDIDVSRTEDLPAEPFTLIRVSRGPGPGWPRLTDEKLRRLEATPTIVGLDAPGAPVTEAGLRSLLAHRKTLTNLYFNGVKLTDAGCAILAELPELDGLNVELAGQVLTDAGVAHLARAPKLRSLWIGGSPVTDACLKPLAEMKTLRSLGLGDTALSDAGVETLAGMAHLEDIGLERTRITEAGYKKLKAALPNCKIQWEPADRAAAGPLLERAGFELRLKLPDGREVEARKPADLPAGAFTLVTVANNAGVVTFGDDDVRRLGQLTGLVGVYVGNHQVTDAGLRPLLNLKETLLAANLPHCGIGDEGAKVLGQLTNLRQTALGTTKLTDAGLKHLAGLTKVTHLGLNALPLTDAGLKHLTGMADLESLNLENTSVTDAAVETLAAFKSLTGVNLRGTRVTAAGVKKLRDALPKCQVEWSPPAARSLRPEDGWLRLSPLIDLAKDHPQGVGTWVKSGAGFLGSHDQPGNAVRLRVPLTVAGDYQLTVDLERPKGGRAAPIIEFPVGDKNGAGIALDLGGKAGIALIDGKDFHENGTVTDFTLPEARSLSLVVRVTTAGDTATIVALVDQKPLVSWKGKISALTVQSGALTPGAIDITFGPPGKLIVHDVRVRMLTGEARPTRPEVGAAFFDRKQP